MTIEPAPINPVPVTRVRIVVAPDKFRGSLKAPEVAEALRAGLLASDPSLLVDLVPVADGGEGTVDAAVSAGFERHTVSVHGPLGNPIDADFAVRGAQAVIEMATASGLDLLEEHERDALAATSRGTGELIRAALYAGCSEILLAVGGSASSDGGAGLLAALGARLIGSDGTELADGGGALEQIERIDLSGLDERLDAVTVILASDVDNPLLGPDGAAAVFGPQKGASVLEVETLDRGLAKFTRTLAASFGAKAEAAALLPGAGAAGGVGYAALAVLGAQRRPGVDLVFEITGLADAIDACDLVITGEGSLDEQSLGGKVPIGVAALAARAAVPVIAVCGRTTLTPQRLAGAGFARVFALMELEPDPTVSMRDAARLLESIGKTIGSSVDSTIDSEREVVR